MAAIHRLAPYHYFLGFDREWSQRPHVDDYTKRGLLPQESLLTLRVPLLDFIFRHIASEGEIKSKIGFVYFVHGLSILLFDHSSWSQLEGLFSSTTLRTESSSTALAPYATCNAKANPSNSAHLPLSGDDSPFDAKPVVLKRHGTGLGSVGITLHSSDIPAQHLNKYGQEYSPEKPKSY
jgi:hypothetical protein